MFGGGHMFGDLTSVRLLSGVKCSGGHTFLGLTSVRLL